MCVTVDNGQCLQDLEGNTNTFWIGAQLMVPTDCQLGLILANEHRVTYACDLHQLDEGRADLWNVS